MAPKRNVPSAGTGRILRYAFPFADQFRSDLHFLIDLETARGQGVVPQLFLDTYGVIDMLAGLERTAQGGRFQKELFHAPESLTYALAYKNWLGPVHLLPPHTGELIFKIRSNDSLLFGERSPNFDKQEQEMWGELGLKSFLFSKKSAKKNWPETLKAESSDLFKAFYLLQERGFWKARYRHLIENGTLCFLQEPAYRMGELTKAPLFEDLNRALNARRKHRSDNNYTDASALCLLDRKLQAFQASSGEGFLPIFHCMQPNIHETVEEFSKNTYAEGHAPFTWIFQGRAHRIVRDSDFFILLGVTNRLREMNHGSYERFMEVARESLSGRERPAPLEDITRLGRGLIDHFEEKVLVEFFKNWWESEKDGEVERLFEESRMGEKQRQKMEVEVAEYIEKERTRLDREFGRYYGRFRFINMIWEKLRKMEAHILQRFSEDEARDLDVFKELSNRFSFPDATCEEIQRLVADIFEAAHRQTGLEAVKTRVVALLIASLFDDFEEEGPTADVIEQKKHDLGIGLAVLWVLQYYDLMEKICEYVKDHFPPKMLPEGDVYPDPTTALLHAAAILKGPQAREERALAIIGCIQNKPKIPSYKTWNSLSFIYFLMMDVKTGHFDFPELCVLKYGGLKPNSVAEAYGRLAGEFCKKSVAWLEGEMAETGGGHRDKHRHRRYCYSLNNLVLHETFFAEPKDFLKAMQRAQLLEASSKDAAVWDECKYSDTLSRFYLRAALLSEEAADFGLFLKWANGFNEHARLSTKTKKNIYETLGRDLERVQRLGFSGVRRELGGPMGIPTAPQVA